MNFAFSEEQDEFRATLRRFLAERCPPTERRRAMESPEGYDAALWKAMAAELGLQGVAIPEACGGQGFGFLELGIALEELGRALVPGPYLASVGLAATAIREAGSEAEQRALLSGIASGETIATLAVIEEAGSWEPDAIALRATPAGDGFRLEGRKCFVPDGALARLVILPARTPDGELGLFRAAADAPRVRATPFEPLDPLRRCAHLDFDGAPAARLGPPGDATAALERILQRGAIAIAAEMTGAAQACLEMAVAYAKQRVQFGRPIGSFQAVKHKAAEVLLEVECAKSAAYWSWWIAEHDAARLAEAAHLAKSACADALLRAAAENVQIHGGIGFTWEHDAQLFLKRAKSSDLLLGDATFHRARLARRLLEESGTRPGSGLPPSDSSRPPGRVPS